jgi:DNA-binding HxlR family transcriptional regulator
MRDEEEQDSSISGVRRPIMALLDILGKKWTLRILWELRDGDLSSRALRSAAGDLSPTVLQARVNELRQAGLVASGEEGYSLTALGVELTEVFLPLYRFADKWAEELQQPEAG